MADSKTYRRLSRSRFGLNGFGTLWLAADHLLQVTNMMGVERYRRWYLNEIQMVVIRRTSRRMIWNLIFGLGGSFFLLIATVCFVGSRASSTGESEEMLVAAGFFAVVALPALAVVVLNTFMGPTCVMHIQTPYTFERVAGPRRVSACEKVLAQLAPLLQTAQVKREDIGLKEVAHSLDQPLP